MAGRNSLTIGEARTLQQDGGVEVVARDILIQPDRYTFADFDELQAYLCRSWAGGPTVRVFAG